jgi:hypothetical protein
MRGSTLIMRGMDGCSAGGGFVGSTRVTVVAGGGEEKLTLVY